MMHSETRVKQIQDIPEQELKKSNETFDTFFDKQYISSRINSALIDLPVDREEKQRLLDLFHTNGEKLITYIQNDIRAIALQLRLSTSDLESAATLSLTISKDEDASMSINDEFFSVNIPTSKIISLLENASPSDYSELSIMLAHEFFHVYVARRYSSAAIKTTEASSKLSEGDNEKYLKDRGEIAAELYAIKHLKSRIKDLDPEQDQDLINAMKDHISQIETDLRNRLGTPDNMSKY